MRTARSSSRRGGLHQAPPRTRPPWSRHPPPEQAPSGAGTPPPGAGTRQPTVYDCLSYSREITLGPAYKE